MAAWRLAIAAAFTWVRQELVDAWSHDAASFALIIYYALAGLALIFAGRFRRVDQAGNIYLLQAGLPADFRAVFVLRAVDDEPLGFETHGQELEDARLVFDDQDPHGSQFPTLT